MRIDRATILDLRHVALHMRDRDLEEFSALHRVDTRSEIAAVLERHYAGRDDIIVACAEDYEPVVVGGALELRPNVLSLFLLGTDRFSEITLPLTRFVRNRLFVPLVAAGAHRIEAITLDTYREMHRWLEVLGLRREATHPGYGKRGETFATYAWTSYVCPSSH